MNRNQRKIRIGSSISKERHSSIASSRLVYGIDLSKMPIRHRRQRKADKGVDIAEP
jgi:hypothetical protein